VTVLCGTRSNIVLLSLSQARVGAGARPGLWPWPAGRDQRSSSLEPTATVAARSVVTCRCRATAAAAAAARDFGLQQQPGPKSGGSMLLWNKIPSELRAGLFKPGKIQSAALGQPPGCRRAVLRPGPRVANRAGSPHPVSVRRVSSSYGGLCRCRVAVAARLAG
jgi:hypothetical protein